VKRIMARVEVNRMNERIEITRIENVNDDGTKDSLLYM
jgi:hypothetical protein